MINKTLFHYFSSLQKQTFLIIFSLGLVRGVGFIRDVAITNIFGVQKNVDIYFYACSFPLFLFGIIALSFNYFLIPNYLRIKSHNPQESSAYLLFIFKKACEYTVLAAAVNLFFISFILIKLNPVFFYSSHDIHQFFYLSLLVTLFYIFFTFVSFFSSILQADHRYLLSFVPQIIIPAGCIILILMFNKFLGVVAVAYGNLLWSMVAVIFFFIYFKKHYFQTAATPITNLVSTNWQESKKELQIIFISMSLAFLPPLIDQQFAASLGVGKLTLFLYGIRIPDGLSEILAGSLGIAVFSYFSQWVVEKKYATITQAIQKIAILTVLFLLPVCGFISLYSQNIISLIFERGLFLAQDTAKVSNILKFYIFGICINALTTVGIKIILAEGKIYFLLITGLIFIVFKVILSVILIKFFDIEGLALCNLILYFAHLCIIFLYLQKTNYVFFDKKFLKYFLKCLALSTITLFVFFIFKKIMTNFDFGPKLLGAFFIFTFGILIHTAYLYKNKFTFLITK